VETPFQTSLLDAEAPSFDRSFSRLERIPLDETSWVDWAPGWVSGSDRIFAEILGSRRWQARTRWMFDRRVVEPRLTAPWSLGAGVPLEPAIVDALRVALGERYGVVFDSAGFNLYRDGRDGVAWHGDKIVKVIAEPIVPLVSLGEPRTFLLRPRGGGRSRAFRLGRGDLLVTGGTTQRTWQHSVPKVARAGPRISIAFRYGLHPRAYGPAEERSPG
jgi:hypothetical protein